MALTVEELAGSPKAARSSKNINTRCNNAKIVRNTTLLEALVKGGYVTSHTTEDGKVKLKILVNKQELKQLLETVNNATTNISNNSSPSPSVESRLYDLMQRKRVSQVNKERQSSNWRPVLRSIPEEH